MKKLISITLTMIISMALFTGCVKGKDDSEKTDVTPQPTPAATQQPAADDETDNALAYQTVLAMWRDMGGYWVNPQGGYLHFFTDENNKACVNEYDRHDTVLSFAMPLTVEASNKTAYVMKFDYPVTETENFKQEEARTATFVIEIAGFADGYVEMSDREGNETVYVFAGKTADELKENHYDITQEAKKLAE